MSKLKGVKTGAFKVTPDNKNQTFGIQSDRESFRCVVPAPVHDFFESSYCSELEAWKAIIMFRVKNPSAMQWDIDDPEQCLAMLTDDFKRQAVERSCLMNDWLIFRAGTDANDIEDWLTTI